MKRSNVGSPAGPSVQLDSGHGRPRNEGLGAAHNAGAPYQQGGIEILHVKHPAATGHQFQCSDNTAKLWSVHERAGNHVLHENLAGSITWAPG